MCVAVFVNLINIMLDVVVVGLGAAGLYGAKTLQEQLPQASLLLLEARPRLGGRTHSAYINPTAKFGTEATHYTPLSLDVTSAASSSIPKAQKDLAIDIGGQWVGPTQRRALELLQRGQVELIYQTWMTGGQPQAKDTQPNNQPTKELASGQVGLSPALGLGSLTQEELNEFLHACELQDKWASELPYGLNTVIAQKDKHTWSKQLREWDEESCGSFFMRTLKTSGARRESYLAVQTLLSAEPFEVSFLAWLSFLKAAGGYAKLDDGVGGAQDAKTRGGMQQLSHTLLHIIQYHAAVFTLKEGVKEIQQTPKQGEVQVRLNAQVKKITRHGCHVVLELPEGVTIRSRRVLIAMSPLHLVPANSSSASLNGSIVIEPALPISQGLLSNYMVRPAAIKTITVFKKKFWQGIDRNSLPSRINPKEVENYINENSQKKTNLLDVLSKVNDKSDSASLPALTYSLPGTSKPNATSKNHPTPPVYGPVLNIFETSVGDSPALVGLITGDSARYWATRPEHELRQAILQQFSRVFDTKEALQPHQQYICNWVNEEFSRGCYSALLPPGILTHPSFHGVDEPVGRLYFACTERANEWPGYIEGALQSGEHAAKQIAQELGAELLNKQFNVMKCPVARAKL